MKNRPDGRGRPGQRHVTLVRCRATARHARIADAVVDLDDSPGIPATLERQPQHAVLQYTRFAPPDRAEYTVGVTGCGQRHTYLVVCTDGGGCVAVAGRAN